MSTFVITGCNRGIGLSLVRELVNQKEKPKTIIATCRDVNKATELQELAKQHPEIIVVHLELNNVKSYGEFVKTVEDIVGGHGLNVLINNAACSPKLDNIDDLTEEDLRQTLDTNLIAPMMLTKALLPLIRRAAKVHIDKPMGIQRAAIINTSSLLGSVSMNNDERRLYGYCYRESKAALNQFTRTLWAQLKKDNILVTVLHPGWVKTDLGGQEAPLTVEESTAGFTKVLYSLDEKKNGRFWAYDGSEIPW